MIHMRSKFNIRRNYRSVSTHLINQNNNIVLQFPGQGSQFVGMAKDLTTSFKCARRVLEEVDEALNMSLSTIMFEGDQVILCIQSNLPATDCH